MGVFWATQGLIPESVRFVGLPLVSIMIQRENRERTSWLCPSLSREHIAPCCLHGNYIVLEIPVDSLSLTTEKSMRSWCGRTAFPHSVFTNSFEPHHMVAVQLCSAFEPRCTRPARPRLQTRRALRRDGHLGSAPPSRLHPCSHREVLPWKLATTDGLETSQLACTIGHMHRVGCARKHTLCSFIIMWDALGFCMFFWQCRRIQSVTPDGHLACWGSGVKFLWTITGKWAHD